MGLDERVDSLDEQVGRLVAQVGSLVARVDRLDERLDKSFVELRAHFDLVAESWDSRFALLYDFFQARADKHDAEIADLKTLVATNNADLRAAIRSTQGSLERRISALERRGHA